MAILGSGTFLISSPALDDPNFLQAVIVICEHNTDGAMGFVVNKLFGRTFNELTEYSTSKAFALYSGGPVEKESLFFVHRRPDLIEGGTLISGSVYLGGNFEQAVTHINQNNLGDEDIKLFIGYCGWDNLELEAEIEEGSWLLANASPSTTFSSSTTIWQNLYATL